MVNEREREGRSHTSACHLLQDPIVVHPVAMGRTVNTPDLFMFLSIINKASSKVSLLTAAPAVLAMTTSFDETCWLRYTNAAWSKNDSYAWK